MFKRSTLAVVGSPDRGRLRAAISARDAAQRELEAAAAVVERVERVISAADDAASRAKQADSEAKTSLATWAQFGCDPQGAAEHEKLAAAADEARRLSDRAQVAAEAARKGLRRAQETVSQAQSDIESCERKIMNEIGLIFLAKCDLERGGQLAAELQAWLIETRGVIDFMQYANVEATRTIRAAFERATIKRIPDYEANPWGKIVSTPPDEVLKLTEAWRALAQRLREDPHAEI